MTTEKVTFDELFDKEAEKSGAHAARRSKLEELNKEDEGYKFHLLTRGERLKAGWLREKAEENIREMLSEGGPKFIEYMTALVKGHGEPFSDRWDACGLLIPPKLKRGEKTAMQRNPALAIQKLLSTEHAQEMTTDVRLLVFWREELPPKKEEHACYGERRIGGIYDQNAPSQTIAALAFKMPGFRVDTVNTVDLMNPRIAIIRDRKREEVIFGQNGSQLIDSLLELSIPETALRLLFSRFALPGSTK